MKSFEPIESSNGASVTYLIVCYHEDLPIDPLIYRRRWTRNINLEEFSRSQTVGIRSVSEITVVKHVLAIANLHFIFASLCITHNLWNSGIVSLVIECRRP